MKAQISLEYIIIVGVLLAMAMPLIYYSFNKTTGEISLEQASDAVNTLARSAEGVYALGPGSKEYVWIRIPGGGINSYVYDKTIELTLHIFGGTSNITAYSKANVTGSFPYQKGTYKIAIEMLDSGIVYIGESNDTTAPIISNLKPVDGSSVNKTPFDFNCWTNEPANCQYSTTETFNYGTGTDFITTGSLFHNSSLNLGDNTYTYYIKCSDESNNYNNDSNQASTTFTVSTT